MYDINDFDFQKDTIIETPLQLSKYLYNKVKRKGFKQVLDKQKIEKQTKKINKLQNQTLILISFFKSLGLKIYDFKKYFKSQKQQQKSYEIER